MSITGESLRECGWVYLQSPGEDVRIFSNDNLVLERVHYTKSVQESIITTYASTIERESNKYDNAADITYLLILPSLSHAVASPSSTIERAEDCWFSKELRNLPTLSSFCDLLYFSNVSKNFALSSWISFCIEERECVRYFYL